MSGNKVIKNASWIIICRVIQAILSLVISMISARYLGPSNYGLINYAHAITAFFLPIMQLGINSIIVREIICHPNEEETIIGTSMLLCVLSSLLCMISIFLFVSMANAEEPTTKLVCVLYSIMLIFSGTEIIQYWFQAKLLSKYVSIVSLCVYILVALYKVYLLASGKSVVWFALSNAVDYFLISLLLYVIFRRITGKKLNISINVARRLLTNGRYYIISGLMVVIFANTDKIMLKLMIDESTTGYYAAAVSCVSMVSFVFSAIIDSMRPKILEDKGRSISKFENSVICLYSIIIYLALCLSIFETILAPLIIHILYGSYYSPSIRILRIIVWYSTFAYYGGAKDVWILAEQKQKYLILLNLSGAIVNVVLNAMMIPIWRAEGAALASLITQIFTNVVMGFVIRDLRRNNILMLKALNPTRLIHIIDTVIHKKNATAMPDEP